MAECQALHHCVGSYVDKVAKQKIIQVRGNGNQEPTPNVKKFMQTWERKVLHGRNLEMEAAA